MGRACDTCGRDYSCIQGFGQTDHLLTPTRIWGRGNIKTDFQVTEWGSGMDVCRSTGVTCSCECGSEPTDFIKYGNGEGKFLN
jgi:hypothetical protein